MSIVIVQSIACRRAAGHRNQAQATGQQSRPKTSLTTMEGASRCPEPKTNATRLKGHDVATFQARLKPINSTLQQRYTRRRGSLHQFHGEMSLIAFRTQPIETELHIRKSNFSPCHKAQVGCYPEPCRGVLLHVTTERSGSETYLESAMCECVPSRAIRQRLCWKGSFSFLKDRLPVLEEGGNFPPDT